MLKIAANKIEQIYREPNLQLITKDFFDLNYTDSFNVITTFRYIRHFEYVDRKKIYQKVCDLLKKDGVFIFDVPNIAAESLLRKHIGWNQFNIYDIFWTEEAITQELNENGFEVAKMIAIGQGLLDDVSGLEKSESLSWVVAAKKK